MPKMVNKGLLLIISSPSGAGKTTICKKLIDEVNDIDLSVSVTTRKKRKDEIEGKHYFFKSEDEFRILLKENRQSSWSKPSSSFSLSNTFLKFLYFSL